MEEKLCPLIVNRLKNIIFANYDIKPRNENE